MPPSSLFYDILIARAREYITGLFLSLPALVFGLIVAIFFWWLARRLRIQVSSSAKATHWPLEIELLIGQVVYFATLVLGIVVVLEIWGQNVSGLVAGLGVVGIAVGFALRNILENFIAGVLLLIQRPFGIGDQIKSGAFEGEVEGISLRATMLQTPDRRQIIIPNATLYTSPIVNLTRYSLRRSGLTLTVNTAQTLDQARQAIGEIVRTVEGVLPTPPPAAVVTGLEDQKITLEVHFWTASDMSTVNQVSSRVVQALAASAEEGATGGPPPIQMLKVSPLA
ncbi:MAG: mechanosensitive ion channel family protein [Ardenticatenaceae bacterium]|nr:mechanosensitive ion channel family protein [Ardenticatenaceae bacterium]